MSGLKTDSDSRKLLILIGLNFTTQSAGLKMDSSGLKPRQLVDNKRTQLESILDSDSKSPYGLNLSLLERVESGTVESGKEEP